MSQRFALHHPPAARPTKLTLCRGGSTTSSSSEPVLPLHPEKTGGHLTDCGEKRGRGQKLLDSLDTAGTEQFTAMRELYMKSGQGFLLVFSITSLSSLTELHELRDQIVRIKDDPQVPLVIVGNKSDLDDERVVSRARAFAVSQSWGNVHYYETSARRRANVDEAFVDLCRQIIRKDAATSTIRDMERGSRRQRDRPSHRHKSHHHKGHRGRSQRPQGISCSIL
ncbi:MAG: hypothetical protein LQ339_001121 [Xanthoria mediterranea]|nr:MAG: hypothetical protein LQ339_001121 [Xanthoria mediterranea]